jgi:hypothetical protein
VAAWVLSWNPDILTTNGGNDLPSVGAKTLDPNVGRYFHSYLYPYNGAFGKGALDGLNRFFPALGDMDATGPVLAKDQSYRDYFTLPGNGRYYEIDWGPVRCFMVDSHPAEPDGRTVSSVQAAWLKERLAAATECWKLVFLNHPPYSSGDPSGSDLDLRWPFEAWGASAVFAGRDRHYERLQVGGIPYFINGAGGAALSGFSKTPLPESVVRYNTYHGAIRIRASAVSMKVEFITQRGVTVDTFSARCPWTPTVTPTATVAPEVLSGDGTRPLFAPNPVAMDRSVMVFLPVATQDCSVRLYDGNGRLAGEYRFGAVPKAALDLKGRVPPGLYTADVRVTGAGGRVKTYQRKLLVTAS